MHKIKRVIKRFNHPISSRGFIGYFVGISLTITSAIAIFNFIIDPYMYYRKPTFYEPIFTNARAQAAGLSRHFEFDSVLTGSSMAENFTISDLSRIMPNPIKLPLSGATANELRDVLNIAFKNRPDLKLVLLNIDFFTYSSTHLNIPNRMPTHFYDGNDIQVILNYLATIKTTKMSLKILRNKQNKFEQDFDNMFAWDNGEKTRKYGQDRVFSALKNLNPNKKGGNFSSVLKWQSKDMLSNFNKFILPIIKSHPNTKFILFFPPYSIAGFKVYEKYSGLDSVFDFKLSLLRELSEFKNVEIFDMQNDLNTITNLDHYADLDHYSPKVNTQIIDKILNGDFKVGKTEKELQDYKNLLNKNRHFILNYRLKSQ